MKKHEYNFLPESSAEDFNNLKNNIKNNGYDKMFPIVVYEGKILDGWHRYKACKELSIEAIYKEFNGDNQKALDYSIKANIHRRHLTSSQKAAIAVESKDLIDKLTAEAKKRQLAGLKQNSPSSKKLDNGTEPKTSHKLAEMFGTNNSYISQGKKLKEENKEVFDKVKSGEITFSEARKEAKRAEKEKQKEAIRLKSKKFDSEDIKIINSDFREYSKTIKDNSIDAVITDPPYPEEYLPLWKDLFEVSGRILKPGGFLVAYTGQLYLDKVIQSAIGTGLDWYWMAALEFTSNPFIHPRNMNNAWKPILIYQKGIKKTPDAFRDKIKMEYSSEREAHEKNWGQTVGPVKLLIEHFTNPDDLIFEPFAGTGTTLVACKESGRRCIGTETDKQYIDYIKGRLV